MSAKKQMLWIAAFRIVSSWAIMKDVFSFWDFSFVDKPAYSMGIFTAYFVFGYFSVSSLPVVGSLPNPAFSLYLNLAQESFDNSCRESLKGETGQCCLSINLHKWNKKPTHLPKVIRASEWPQSASELVNDDSLFQDGSINAVSTIAA